LPAVTCLFIFKPLGTTAIAQWAQYIPNIPRQITELEVMDGGNYGTGTTAVIG
jgi:hypothetical protein